MSKYIGIDLGTGSTKLVLTNELGEILRSTSLTYPVYYPQDGWSEQEPTDWYNAIVECILELTADGGEDIAGLAVGGQMHGLVALDSEDNVLRRAILWNDGRCDKQTAYLNEVVGRDKLLALTGNIAYAGFTAPKILWMREQEPQLYARIAKIMLPKDYIVYRLTGIHATDVSDASGTLLLDVRHRTWSSEMCEICGVTLSTLPQLYESYQPVGTLLPHIADSLHLSRSCRVIAGAGDNAAAAVGTGTVGEGGCNISLGTSGTVFVSQREYASDGMAQLHSFCHADGGYHQMGCILSAASCNQWWTERILNTDYSALEGAAKRLGANNVYFLPYLMGERSPHNDVHARGAFIGLQPTTDATDMSLAVVEGVAFALRDCVEIARHSGAVITRATLCGGGARSSLMQRIMANVLDVDILLPQYTESVALGAAILAMVGCGEYRDVATATAATTKNRVAVHPETDTVSAYDRRYHTFTQFYPALTDCFSQMSK